MLVQRGRDRPVQRVPVPFAAELVRTRGVAVADTVVTKVVFFAIFAAFFLLVHRRKAARIHYLLILPALARGWMLAVELAHLYPFVDQEPSLRALLAVLVGLLALKEASFKEEAAPHRKVVLGTLFSARWRPLPPTGTSARCSSSTMPRAATLW